MAKTVKQLENELEGIKCQLDTVRNNQEIFETALAKGLSVIVEASTNGLVVTAVNVVEIEHRNITLTVGNIRNNGVYHVVRASSRVPLKRK